MNDLLALVAFALLPYLFARRQPFRGCQVDPIVLWIGDPE